MVSESKRKIVVEIVANMKRGLQNYIKQSIVTPSPMLNPPCFLIPAPQTLETMPTKMEMKPKPFVNSHKLKNSEECRAQSGPSESQKNN